MDLDFEFNKLNKKISNIDTKVDILIDEVRFTKNRGCTSCKKGFLHFNEFVYENGIILSIRYICDYCNLIFER